MIAGYSSNSFTAIHHTDPQKVTPVITWAAPAPIIYGSPLKKTQLNATASVAGTFIYSLPIGTVLRAGTQTLEVTFTPSDTTRYNSARKTVSLTVKKAPLVIKINDISRQYGADSISLATGTDLPVISDPVPVTSLASLGPAYVPPNAGCTDGKVAFRNNCTFRYPLWNMQPHGTGFPYGFLWGTGYSLSSSPNTCFNMPSLQRRGIDTYVDFIYTNRSLYLVVLDDGLHWNMQVNGNWVTRYPSWATGSTGRMMKILVTFPDARRRNIRIYGTLSFYFGGVVAEASTADVVAPTPRMFPTAPVLVMRGDSTSGMGSPFYLSIPIDLGMRLNMPVANLYYGGVGFASPDQIGNVPETKRVSDLINFFQSIGQSTGYMIWVDGLNDASFRASYAQEYAAASQVFSTFHSALPGVTMVNVGPFEATTLPIHPEFGDVKRAIRDAMAASGGYNPVDMGTEGYFDGVEVDQAPCPDEIAPASTRNNCFFQVEGGGAHSVQAGADYVSSRLAMSLTSPSVSLPTPLPLSYRPPAPPFSGSVIGLRNGDVVNVVYSSPAEAFSPVGTYPIFATISGTDAGNYSVTVRRPGKLTVTKAQLTVVPNVSHRSYGHPDPMFTAGIMGLVNGDSSSVVSGGATIVTETNGSSPAGQYPTFFGTKDLEASNYTVSYLDGTLTVTMAPTITTISPASTPAGGSFFTLTVEGTGFISGIEIPVTAKWDNTVLATRGAGPTRLTATIPATLITQPGNHKITVTSLGGASNQVVFVVGPSQ